MPAEEPFATTLPKALYQVAFPIKTLFINAKGIFQGNIFLLIKDQFPGQCIKKAAHLGGFFYGLLRRKANYSLPASAAFFIFSLA
ncbi:hypothetical protein [Hymenobacter guriensis]|uniref:Uncharacterized protein n=1 Tax=Hymenobacter guriensis TaxID=2793065 RepID=A0ABS0KZX4_9BACT|nr:hypothetical protein [Hymenobacter guriensis]MBG8552749.1 hypothetical protein [Hymenobacter guriensis]